MEQGVEGYWLLAEAVEIKGIHHTDNQWMIEAKTIGNKARCPSCGQASERVHSYYRRTLRAVPWGGEPVQLQLHVRRFRCQNALCPCVTFAERLPTVVGWHKQRTLRLTTSLVHLVMTMSAETGARLLPHLGIKTSADALLRILRQQVAPQVEPPRVIGVDEL